MALLNGSNTWNTWIQKKRLITRSVFPYLKFRNDKIDFSKILSESKCLLDSAKLRAESANSIGVLISYVCRVPCAVFAFVTHMPRFLHTLVSHMLRAVRALVLHVPPVFLRLPCLVSHILLCVMCLTWHMLNVLSCFICLLPSVLSCSLCLTYFTCLMSNILSSSSSPLVICLLSFRIFSYLIIFPAWQCTKNEVFH